MPKKGTLFGTCSKWNFSTNKPLFTQIHFLGVQELIVFKSSINKILSPVDFISGPNALFTLWNLLNEKTGCFGKLSTVG
jgi:hypothetical protein